MPKEEFKAKWPKKPHWLHWKSFEYTSDLLSMLEYENSQLIKDRKKIESILLGREVK